MSLNNKRIKLQQPYLFKYQRLLRDNKTRYELLFEKILINNNIKFIAQKGFFNNDSFYLVDYYLPRPYKTVIEIDGEYHDNRVKKDIERDKFFINKGFRVIRILNKDVKNFEIKTLIQSMIYRIK
jgi:very-short-patch-repair endonuclease